MKEILSRRDFIRASAAAGAAHWAADSSFAGQEGNADGDLNIAFIGAGAQGQQLIDICLKAAKEARIRISAVCDIWEEVNLVRVTDLLKRLGHDARTYVNYSKMLDGEKELDAVIIATPDSCHAQQTVDCLKAGVAVYCEAPMSNTIDGARLMVRTAEETGKHLQIGHQRRSNPRYIHCLQNLLQSAKILGNLVAANGQYNRQPRPDIGWPKSKVLTAEALAANGFASMHQYKNWMWYKGLGTGPTGFYGSHQIDVFNWFLGAAPKRVTARGGTYYYDPKNHEWADTVMAVLEYQTEKGVVCVQYQTLMGNGYGGTFEAFLGNHGSLETSESPSRGGVYRDPGAPDWDTWVRLGFLNKPGEPAEEKKAEEGVIEVAQTKPPTIYEIPVKLTDPYYKPHLLNFFDAVRGKAALNCPARSALPATIAAIKLNEVIQSGTTVELSGADIDG